MSNVLEALSPSERALVRRAKQPAWIEPMRASLTDERFSDPEWLFEPKLDGERCLVFKRHDKVRLLSRNQKSMDASYPELVAAISRQETDSFIVDSEIVAFDGDVPSFARLQRRMHVHSPTAALVGEVPVFLYAFDIVHVVGHDVTTVPLRARKKLLKEALSFRKPLRVVTHRDRDGEAYYEEMCGTPGWEGLIAKRADSPYRPTRSRDWLKFKCSNEQEFVIGGYTDPQGSRTGFGALLVGYYEDGDLKYAGKVGTGFGREMLAMLTKELRSRTTQTSPFSEGGGPRHAHWVEPELVAQIGFGEWTPTGRLRHPRFMGLRRDKKAADVVRERP